jgi:hypothetical protein
VQTPLSEKKIKILKFKFIKKKREKENNKNI